MELTERDRDIIRHVHRHRFLRSSHIAALMGGSRQQLLRRLQRLYHHEYLERPRAQIDYYHRGGSRCLAYGLGSKGAALLKREFRLPNNRLGWSAKNAAVGRLFLEHALMVSDVMVAVELACRRKDRVRLLTGDEIPLPAETLKRREPFGWTVNLPNRTKLGVVPDRVFALEFADQPKERNRVLYFLEADRATMPVARHNLAQSSFHRKLLAYEATWRQGIHRSRFGFHRFRVLTVTSSPQRVESLVGACTHLERGHGLFLFGDRHSLAQADLFTYDWKTGRPPETARLMDPGQSTGTACANSESMQSMTP